MHALLEGRTEGAVAMVAALLGQLLGDDGFLCSGKLTVASAILTALGATSCMGLN